MVTVEITYAAPHHLLAEGPVLAVRRTRAGDAWEKRNAAEAAKPAGVMLGLPKIGAPGASWRAPASGCGDWASDGACGLRLDAAWAPASAPPGPHRGVRARAASRR